MTAVSNIILVHRRGSSGQHLRTCSTFGGLWPTMQRVRRQDRC
jgi:hypothetical protein